jgi:hypothetical protein
MTAQLRGPHVLLRRFNERYPHVARIRTAHRITPAKPLQSRACTPFAFFISLRMICVAVKRCGGTNLGHDFVAHRRLVWTTRLVFNPGARPPAATCVSAPAPELLRWQGPPE